MTTIWQVRLFNGPVLLDAAGNETRRFRSRKVGALLAYLALNLGRPCPREELYEALWPEEDAHLAANRFRVTLAWLRRQMEPADVLFGAVLDVREPGRVRLRAEAVACDTWECERLLRTGQSAQAARLLTGPLLPGYYEEWALAAQTRFAMLAEELELIGCAPPTPRSPEVSEAETRNLATSSARVGQARPQPAEPEQAASGQTPRAQTWAKQAEPEQTDVFSERRSPPLPLYLTRLFGRENELQSLRALVRANRQVSLVGMGGMGKTRLSVELANGWDGECRFVSLAALPDASRLYDTVLQSLGVAPQTDAPTEEQLIRVLSRRGALLLILDNAEHLSDAVAAMTLYLLAHVPGLRLLVTSRRRLDIAGETVLLLTPLEAPGPAAAHAERLLEFAAVSLFVDRAKTARPDFTLSERNAPAVAEICKRLEGIPLGLELAAARVTSQSPQQIAHSLEHHLTDLKSRQHGLSLRHQSLRSVVQGSLDLLSPAQQAFFLALAVFQGGWSAQAAQAVTGCAQAEVFLHDLTLCSLVVVREEERLGTMRYTLLETLRQFAAQGLALEAQEMYRERHARFYMDMAAQADEEGFRFMDRMEADHENILQAMEWQWQRDRAALLPLLQGILNTWANRGRHRLALEWIARFRAEHALLARQYKQGMFTVYVDAGRYEEAEEMVRLTEHDAPSAIHSTSIHMARGYIRMMQGVWNEAVELQRRATLDAYDIEGEQRDIIIRLVSSNTALALLGRAMYQADSPNPLADYQEAEQHIRRGYSDLPEGSRLESAYYWHLMCACWGQSRDAEGDYCFARALAIALAHRHLATLMKIMGDGAFRLAAKGHAAESVQMFSAERALREKMGYRLPAYQEARIREHLRALREQMGEEMFDRRWQSGLYTPLEIFIPSVLLKIYPDQTTEIKQTTGKDKKELSTD